MREEIKRKNEDLQYAIEKMFAELSNVKTWINSKACGDTNLAAIGIVEQDDQTDHGPGKNEISPPSNKCVPEP